MVNPASKTETRNRASIADDHRDIQLQQLANIVIDAYLRRGERYKPDFEGSNAVMYLERPKGDKDHPELQLGHWYQNHDFESEDRS
jgi:hypothetical protein